MVISERRRLTFTVIAVILLAILTWLLIYGMLLLPPRQYLSSTKTPTTPELIQAQRTNEVTIWGNDFYPMAIIVPVGTTVTWTNVGFELHTVTTYTDLFSLDLAFGDSLSYTFNEPGTYAYFCVPHESEDMTGKVIVE